MTNPPQAQPPISQNKPWLISADAWLAVGFVGLLIFPILGIPALTYAVFLNRKRRPFLSALGGLLLLAVAIAIVIILWFSLSKNSLTF